MSEWGSVVVRIASDVAWTSTALRVVAMDLSRSDASPYLLESTAAAVWGVVAEEGVISTDALLHNLAQTFDVKLDEIRPGVETLLADLVSRYLFEIDMAEGSV